MSEGNGHARQVAAGVKNLDEHREATQFGQPGGNIPSGLRTVSERTKIRKFLIARLEQEDCLQGQPKNGADQIARRLCELALDMTPNFIKKKGVPVRGGMVPPAVQKAAILEIFDRVDGKVTEHVAIDFPERTLEIHEETERRN